MKRKTHTKDGQELSDMFISDDNTLSKYFLNNECEVVGYGSNVFGESIMLKYK